MADLVNINGEIIENQLCVQPGTDEDANHGLMCPADKLKLDGIAEGANKYTHPSYTARTGVPTANATPAFGGTFTISQPTSDNTGHITAINSRTITIPSSVATTSVNGLMSSTDKTKLDGIATGANAYTHPASHAATMITEDTTHRFVTDTEKSTWNAKASTAAATTSANGLMTSTMVTKLNGIAAGANAYTHPTTTGNKHIPSGGASGQILRWSADGTATWGSDNNTTYSAGTGLSLSGTIFNHSNSITAATASEGGSARTLGFGGTFNIPSITYDAQGHITGKSSITLTMPANPNVNTEVTNTLGTTTKAYITGTTSATTNTGTQIFDTGVYLDTTAGRLTATSFKTGSGVISYDSTLGAIKFDFV